MHRNNTTFGKYCNKRLSNSLITGIPKIVSTKNSQRKAFKLTALFFSIVGFLWQTYTFCEIYLDYPVVQHVTIEEPEVFSAPAVTLCSLNRLNRQRFCDFTPGSCVNVNVKVGLKKFCIFFEKFCPAVRAENYTLMVPKITQDEINSRNNEFLQAAGPQSQVDLLEKCTVEMNAKSKTCNDSIMIQVSDGGLPYRCFTFFSLIDEPNKSAQNFSLTDSYIFRLNLHPEENMSYDDLVGIHISVHDPKRLKNPFVEHVILQSGRSYRLFVTMEHRQNLPPPYETNCVDYITLWKENGGLGPLTKSVL